MRRLMLSAMVLLAAGANLGCLAVVSNETLAASTKRVAVVEGQMYIIDLETHTAKTVKMVREAEVITETTVETTSEATIDEAHP